MKRIKKIEFPPVVLQFLKKLKDTSDPRLPVMQGLTASNDEFKRMWIRILEVPRTDLYKNFNDEGIVESFLDAVIYNSKELTPVLLLTEKEKQRKIDSIHKCEARLNEIYTELFSKEAASLQESLHKHISEVETIIKNSYLISTGKRKKRIVSTFIRDLAQSNLWVYGKQLDSTLKTAALGRFNYRFAANGSISKITKKDDIKTHKKKNPKTRLR